MLRLRPGQLGRGPLATTSRTAGPWPIGHHIQGSWAVVHWPPSRSGGLARHQEQPLERKQKPLKIPALGMPTESPLGALQRQPDVDLGEFALFCSAEEVPVASGSCAPETRTCQWWGGMDGASGRLKAKNCAVRVPLQGHGQRGSSLGKHWHGWTLPKCLSPAVPSTTRGLKINPGCIFF